MGTKHDALRGKLTNAIVEVCRQEAFYFQELRIEGTVCLVSDGSSVLIAQITEQIGDKSLEFPDEGDRCRQDLPVLDSSNQSLQDKDDQEDEQHTKETKKEEKRILQEDRVGATTPIEKSPNRHSATMYTKERVEGKYKCPFCPKKYRFKHSLKDHINTHTGKKPHLCKHCGQAFTHLASLCAHIRRKHSQLMPTDFRCTICKELFMNDQSLKQHHTFRHKMSRPGSDEESRVSSATPKEGDSVEQILAAEFASSKPAQPALAEDSLKKEKEREKPAVQKVNETEERMKEIAKPDALVGLKQFEPAPPTSISLENSLPSVTLNQPPPGMILPDFNQAMTHPLPPTSLFQASLDFQQQALAMGISSQPHLPMGMGVGPMFPGLSPLPFPFPAPSPTRGQPQPIIPDLSKVSLPPSIIPTSTPIVSSPSPYGDFHRTEDGKFQCPYCEKSYNFKHTLKDHINKHTGKRPHVCKHCGDSFTHLASLCNHIKRRHEEKIPEEFQCDICHERFMNYQSVKQHYTWRHKNEKFPKRFSYTGGSIGKRTLTGGFHPTPESPGCDQGSTPGSAASVPTEQEIIDEIAGELSMGEAMATVATTTAGTAITTSHPVQSSWPNKFPLHQSVFPGQVLGAEHIDLGNHGNPELKNENNLPTLPDDIAAVRGFEEQVPLPDDCDMQALLDCDLPAGPGQGQCDYGGDSCCPPKNIMEYFESVDIQTEQGHYKYKCKVCGNLFKIRNSLHEHVNSHLGRKPHVCSFCGDSFTHHSTLHNHIKNKHTYQTREEKEASFRHQCNVCQRRFRYPSEMERHFKTNPDHELVAMETEGLS